MPIRDYIPSKILESQTVTHFIDVMERLIEYKHTKMSQGLRASNVATSVDKKWLISLLQEYGVKDFPYNIPLEILLQFSLNIHTILNLRGSKRGIQMYCSVLSLGDVSIDDSEFIKDTNLLLLDSKRQGVIVDTSLDSKMYLASNSTEINPPATLSILIKSKYFNGNYTLEETSIKEFIKKTLPDYLGFSPDRVINYTFEADTQFKYDSLLNNYFV